MKFRQSIAPFATALMMVGMAAFTGCEKKPEASASRLDDPSYMKELDKTRVNQNRQAAARARLVTQMQAFVARAREALPKDATDDQVLAELDGNPAKYPGWKTLKEAFEQVNAGIKDEMAKAREVVRKRILKEMADRKAAEQGRAGAKPAAK